MNDVYLSKDERLSYRIVNSFTVFPALSKYVMCKHCSGEVKFNMGASAVLMHCVRILVGSVHEINRRFIFAMGLLDILD